MKVCSLILPRLALCVIISCCGTVLIYTCLYQTSIPSSFTHRQIANLRSLAQDNPVIWAAWPPDLLSIEQVPSTLETEPGSDNATSLSASSPLLNASTSRPTHFSSPYMCLVDDNHRILAEDTTCYTGDIRRTFWNISRRSAEKFIERGSPGDVVRARTFSNVVPCWNGSINCFQVEPVRGECLHSDCQFTSNWRDADILVFHAVKFQQSFGQLNITRRTDQRWVMRTQEAPCRARNFAGLLAPLFYGQFNWSLTFRLDSDIVLLYGKLKRLTSLPAKDYDALYSGKSQTAAWFVSHCSTQSRRMPYVRRMQKVVDVDIFGLCGNYSCVKGKNKRGSDHDQCFPLLSSRYFFYLAFENSICNDYVTEKFFKLFTNADVIPVVRGGADYKRYFPPDTFIDASDFDSPEVLGIYLKDLSRDKDRYLHILREKNRYEYVEQHKWPCRLCDKMKDDTSVQWYPGNNMWTWFVQDQCNNPE